MIAWVSIRPSVPAKDSARHCYIGVPAAIEIPSPGDRTEPRYKVERLNAVATHDEVRHELAVDLIQLHVLYPVIWPAIWLQVQVTREIQDEHDDEHDADTRRSVATIRVRTVGGVAVAEPTEHEYKNEDEK